MYSCEQVSSRPRRGRWGVQQIFKNEKRLSKSKVTSKGARDGLVSCQRLLDSRHHYGYHTLWLYVACLSVLLTIYICVGLDQKWFSYIFGKKTWFPAVTAATSIPTRKDTFVEQSFVAGYQKSTEQSDKQEWLVQELSTGRRLCAFIFCLSLSGSVCVCVCVCRCRCACACACTCAHILLIFLCVFVKFIHIWLFLHENICTPENGWINETSAHVWVLFCLKMGLITLSLSSCRHCILL